MLIKMKLNTSAGFRALGKCGSIINECLNLFDKTPCYTTILNWVLKIGYCELNKIKKRANDWVLILDESIQLGKDKILVVFGIRESEIDFTKPLNFQNLTPLREISKTSWTGELIKTEISNLQNELGKITYVVGDYGSDIKKGLKLLGLTHVHDITHKIALILEKLFKDNADFKEVTQKMSEMRSKFAQTEIAHLIPPKQRKKSRYQNLKIISDWCLKALNLMESNQEKTKKVTDNLEWILSYKSFILEIFEINEVICDIEKILKHNGLSDLTMKKCDLILKKLTSKLGILIKEKIDLYFKDTIEMLPKKKKILITSDIIESAFGKYKNYVSCNPMAGVTNLVLCIAAFTSSLNEEKIKNALETTTVNDIMDWTKEFIGETLLQKRKKALCFT